MEELKPARLRRSEPRTGNPEQKNRNRNPEHEPWNPEPGTWNSDRGAVPSLASVLEFSFLPTGESRELVDDLRQVFADLAATLGPEQRAHSGEYHPALDVVETSSDVEIVID